MAIAEMEIGLTQVEHGFKYKGHVTINGTKRSYELTFMVPIPELDDYHPQTVEDVRKIFSIAILREEEAVDLTDAEFSFFFQQLIPIAVEFYNSPQTQDSQEGFLGMMIRGDSPISNFATAEISISRSGRCDFSKELVEMLTAPKFGFPFED